MKKRIQGFTLIELLIILVIVGFLAALLVPAMRSTREQAHALDCMNNMKQLVYAAFMYADDHDGVIPDVAPNETGTNPNLATSNYIDDEDVYLCPRDTRTASQFGTFKTSYTAWQGTITTLLPGGTIDGFSECILYIESDLAGKYGRVDIARDDAEPRHNGRTITAYADGHLSSVFLGSFIPGDEPEEPAGGGD